MLINILIAVATSFVVVLLIELVNGLREIDWVSLNREKHFDVALDNWRAVSRRYADDIEKLTFDYRLVKKGLNKVNEVEASPQMLRDVKDAIARLTFWSESDARPYLSADERDALRMLDII